jgi:hypothetical protein
MVDYGVVINALYMVLTMFDFWLFIVAFINKQVEQASLVLFEVGIRMK